MKTMLLALGLVLMHSAHAAPITVLHELNGTPDGASPSATLTIGSDGNFYGTAAQGGGPCACGTVFRITPAGAYTVLHTFSGTDGSTPYGQLVQGADGNFYGTTWVGGAHNTGTVFRITPAGAFTSLYSFSEVVSFQNQDGANPVAGLTRAPDGSFYGTTEVAGSGGGTIFRITPAGVLTTLHKFVFEEGELSTGGVIIGADGKLYGGTIFYGAGGAGTIYRFDPVSLSLTVLHAFSGPDGYAPWGRLVQAADGALYGTTRYGGASDQGAVFKVTTSGVFTLLHSLTGAEGIEPVAGLMQANDGAFYGIAEFGGGGAGTIFRVTSSGQFNIVHTFEGGAGAGGFPFGGLVQSPLDGNFYGTTLYGSQFAQGIVFRMAGLQRPPVWIAPTPANGSQFTLTITRPFSFSLRASDPDVLDQVHIAAVAPPAGSTLASTDGHPAAATFRWKPAAGQAGDHTVSFQAWGVDAPLSAAPARTYRLRVKKRGTAMSAQPAILQGDPLHITLFLQATLTATDPSQPLGGEPVRFTTTGGDLICAATTNSKGIAACSGVGKLAAAVSSFGYVARFDGDEAYEASSQTGYLIK